MIKISPEAKRLIALADDPRWKYSPVLFGKIYIKLDEVSSIYIWSGTMAGIMKNGEDEISMPSWGYIDSFAIHWAYKKVFKRTKKEWKQKDAQMDKELFNAFFDKWKLK